MRNQLNSIIPDTTPTVLIEPGVLGYSWSLYGVKRAIRTTNKSN